MDGATGAAVNNAHIHILLPLSLRFLLLAHSRVPLSSHHPLYSKLPPSFPLSFPLLLCPNTLRHLFSHSIMLLLDAFFPFLFYPHPLSLHFLFNFPPYFSTIVPSLSASHPTLTFPFPISLLIPPSFPCLFIPCCSLPLSLWSLTYLFGADIVVFMRAASPTAAEGRPHNLALVAALGLVRQMDIWIKTSKETNNLTNRGTFREGREKRGKC